MKTPVYDLFVNICVDDAVVRAAICPRCSARIYPVKLLKPHLVHHQLRENRLVDELKKLQVAMGRMR